MNTVYLGLGSNLGEREENLENALQMLSKRMTIEQVSPVYETDPVGHADQAWFLNMVYRASTGLDPAGMLDFAKQIERRMGRQERFRNAPREIDIDILFFNDEVIESGDLVIPHTRIAERAFVLVPLADIAPSLVHPGIGKTVKDLLSELVDPEEVRKWGNVSSIGSAPF